MSNAKKFEELLRSDETLQEKLRAATDAYTGNQEDERAAFEATVAPLAAEAGLPFTYEEAKELATEGSEKLSLDDLDSAAGGADRGCFFIGFGECGSKSCTVRDDNKEAGATACCGVGAGFIYN